jgi:Domain of unknown function (DUF4113)
VAPLLQKRSNTSAQSDGGYEVFGSGRCYGVHPDLQTRIQALQIRSHDAGLRPDNVSQGEFDFEVPETRHRGKLMGGIDAINDRFGRGAIRVGSAAGVVTPWDWSMRQERLTPQYNTKFSDLPVARA